MKTDGRNGRNGFDPDAPLMTLQDIWKIYDLGEAEVHALRGVSLTIERGDYGAIMGPSGSGKSTLMNIIGCLDRPTAGQYLLGGRPVADLEDNALADIRRERMGFVFQSFHLLARRTAVQNVMLPLIYSGRGGKERRALAALDAVGIGDRAYHLPNQLSGGQAQRVAIARAIVNDPEVILADEPTGALDTKSGAQVMDILDSLNAKGITVIVVTHEPHVGERARRMLRFLDGQIVSDMAT